MPDQTEELKLVVTLVDRLASTHRDRWDVGFGREGGNHLLDQSITAHDPNPEIQTGSFV